MNYLYGDSTPSQLTSNFLEFLRDALDFSVFVLQADGRIQEGQTRARALREGAASELERLHRFIGVVSAAVQSGDIGAAQSPTAQCAARVSELLSSSQSATSNAISAMLADDIGLIAADETATRAACLTALGNLLWPHMLPDASTTQWLNLVGGRRYEAAVVGNASFGLDWSFDLAIPDGAFWSTPVPLERIAHIEIRTPQVVGWLTKEVKIRPQKLERFVVTELTTSDGASFVKLRLEPGLDTGFDLEADTDINGVKMTRVGAADDASVGPFDVHPDDVGILLELVERLRKEASTLEPARLAQATFDEADVQSLPGFVPLVERIIAMLAPIVNEISARSLTPTELVLRRALGDDRREEVFMAKAMLREKYAPLAPHLRALFTPLGFDVVSRPASVAPPPMPAAAPPAPRPPSMPPPRPPSVAPPRPVLELVPAEPARPPPTPPPQRPPPPPPRPRAPEIILAPAEVIAEVPSLRPPASEGRNERFVEAVKKIVLVLKSGRTDEGYQQYADLLSAASFSEYRPDDQRQALKMLLLAKPPATRTDPVVDAYRVALARIQALVDAFADPADYEMLGVARLQLEERQAAVAAFQTALKLERARNPASELCGSLERRVSQL